MKLFFELTKEQTIKEFDKAQELADKFKSEDGTIFGVFVMNISLTMGHSFLNYDIFEERNYDAKEEGCKYHQIFALTTTGEPIGMIEYCERLTRNPSVHCVLFYDHSEEKYEQE